MPCDEMCLSDLLDEWQVAFDLQAINNMKGFSSR